MTRRDDCSPAQPGVQPPERLEEITPAIARMATQAARAIPAWRAQGASDFDILLAQTQAACERFDARVAALEPRDLACGKGCFHCCYLSVGATFGEALYVARFLRDVRPDLIPRAQESAERFRSLATSTDRFHAALPCPFLAADKTCAVYPVRPLACRSGHSPDASLCGPFNDPEGVKRIPQHEATREAAVETLLGLAVLNNLVTGRPVTGEFVNGVVCGLEALEDNSLAPFDDWFRHAETGE